VNDRFYPPKDSAWVRGAVNCCFPLGLRCLTPVRRVSVAAADWEHLQALEGGRALLLPNHPTVLEPLIMAWLSRQLRLPFNYVATDEIFTGLRGWLVQRLGAYSIRRGRPDRKSLRTTRRLLAEEDRQLVIFPEGETHTHNDKVIPLHPGALQMGFWCLERLEELGKPISLPVLPLFIKYRYLADAGSALRAALGRLEQCLGLDAGGDSSLVERVRRAAMEVLAGVESEYGFRPPAEATLDERVARLQEYIVQRAAQVIQVEPPRETAVHLRLRTMCNRVYDYLHHLDDGLTAYQRRLDGRREVAVRGCLNDLERLQNFMAVSEDYLAPPHTQERLGEIIARLEKEVLGKRRLWPPCEAVVRVARPLELAERLPAYRADRRAAVAESTAEVEARLRALSRETRDLGIPASPSAPAATDSEPVGGNN